MAHTVAADADPGPAVTMLPSLLTPTEMPLPKPSCSWPVGVVVVVAAVVPGVPAEAVVVSLAELPLPTAVIKLAPLDGSASETHMWLGG